MAMTLSGTGAITGSSSIAANSVYLATSGGGQAVLAPAASSSTYTITVPAANANMGILEITQNAQAAGYTLVLGDSGKSIYMTSAGAFTIPANSSVAFPIGTAVTFINMNAGACTIVITSDTMYQTGTGTTGTRTLAQYGLATVVKMTATTWMIAGSGMT
jgi:hypothetical protein